MNAESRLAGLIRQLPAANTDGQSDAVLLARYVRSRDEAAFSAIVQRYGSMVLGVARRQLAGSQQADDVFQGTFLALARSASRLTRPKPLANWLYTVALRQARKARAKSARQSALEVNQVLQTSPASDPLSTITGRELIQLVDDELARLPEKYRLPVLLCGVQGLSRDEAAQQLGWTEGTLRGRLERGRRQLAERLAKRGVTPLALLLSPFAVPSDLSARTIELAMSPLTTNIPSAVLSLAAHGHSKLMPSLVVACSLLVVGLAGIIIASGHGPVKANPASPVAKEKQTAESWDDPLPEGSTLRLGTDRFRQGTDIEGMAVAPDGSIAVVHHRWLGRTRAFDLKTGRVVYALEQATSDHEALAFAPDGKTLVTKNLSKIQLWDATTGKAIRTINRPRNNGGALTPWLAITPDGKSVALSSANGKTIELVDLTTGEISQTFAHSSSVFIGRFSADGKWLAACGYDSDDKGNYFARLWDVTTGKELRQFSNGHSGMRALAFSPDKSLLAAGGDDGRLRVWDTVSGKQIHNFPKNGTRLRCVVFSPDGKTFAAASRSIRLYDTATGKERLTIDRNAKHLHFSADGKTLTAAVEGAIHHFDTVTGVQKTPQGSDSGVEQIIATPDGKKILTRDQSGAAHIWDAASGQHLKRLAVGDERGMALSPDGRFLVWSTEDPSATYQDTDHDNWTRGGYRIRLYDLTAEKLIDRFPGFKGDAHDLTFTADGKTLLTVDHNSGFARQWDVATGKELRSFRVVREDETKLEYFVRKSVVSPDGKTLAVGYGPAGRATLLYMAVNARIFDVATGKELFELKGHWNNIESLAFSPDSRLLATGGETMTRQGMADGDRQVLIWEVATGKRIPFLEYGLPLGAQRLAFSPDGRTLITASAGGAIRTWEVASWTKRAQQKGHRDQVSALAFTPDGKLLSGGTEATVLAWNTRPQKPSGEISANAAFEDLVSPEATTAYRAQGRLLAEPEETISLLRKHIPAARPFDAKQLALLIADLDSPKFTVREVATRELRNLGAVASVALQEAASKSRSDEVRKRAEDLLAEMKKTVRSPEELRAIRAVEILEWIATPAARTLLTEWSTGDANARLTQDSTAALRRLLAARR